MQSAVESQTASFRVWLVEDFAEQPDDWYSLPSNGRVVEPASEGCFARREAEAYVRAFNEEMVRVSGTMWAVAVPVQASYAGDLTPGLSLDLIRKQICAFATNTGSG